MATLLDQIPEGGIALGLRAADWRDLNRQVGQLLESVGLGSPEYTVAMERNIDANGPYLVIAPGLALLHARPDEGARKPGIVLATVAEPVAFGHSTNDPVRVAIGLTAVDSTGHIEVLTALATALGVPGAVDRIADASDLDAMSAVLTDLSAGGQQD